MSQLRVIMNKAISQRATSFNIKGRIGYHFGIFFIRPDALDHRATSGVVGSAVMIGHV
jgi:hypothetical protein